MTKQEAYNIVYNDIINGGVSFFTGTFDATNGSKQFMYGIETVMDYIAFCSGEDDYENFQNIWAENFQKSLDKANKE